MAYEILKIFSIFTLVAIIGYSIVPQKYRHIVLLTISILCIAYYSHFGVAYLLITILTTFFAGLVMEKIDEKHSTKGLEKAERKAIKALAKKYKKIVVFGYILINIGILFVLKYSKMFISVDHIPNFLKIAMPLGISYYTLQSLSYVIDVFRGKFKCEKDPLKLALFVCFLPQLHEGPFGRYDQYINDLCKNEPLKRENIFNGIGTILWGLFKIFMIANRASMVADNVFQYYKEYTTFGIFIGGVFFTLQLYAEFSGYIDVARGIAEIFGIRLAENFNMPFISKDVAEFWRRWHISLGEWFRDYVFYPVSTCKIFKKMPDFIMVNSALLAVWFLTGLWHGASWKYVVYGLYYFVLMVLLNYITPLMLKVYNKFGINPENKGISLIKILFTQFLVVVGMIIFRSKDLVQLGEIIKDAFSSSGINSLAVADVIYVMDVKEWIVFIVAMVILIAISLIKMKGISIRHYYNQMSSVQKYLVCFGAACFVIIFGAYGFEYVPPDPIYGGF